MTAHLVGQGDAAQQRLAAIYFDGCLCAERGQCVFDTLAVELHHRLFGEWGGTFVHHLDGDGDSGADDGLRGRTTERTDAGVRECLVSDEQEAGARTVALKINGEDHGARVASHVVLLRLHLHLYRLLSSGYGNLVVVGESLVVVARQGYGQRLAHVIGSVASHGEHGSATLLHGAGTRCQGEGCTVIVEHGERSRHRSCSLARHGTVARRHPNGGGDVICTVALLQLVVYRAEVEVDGLRSGRHFQTLVAVEESAIGVIADADGDLIVHLAGACQHGCHCGWPGRLTHLSGSQRQGKHRRVVVFQDDDGLTLVIAFCRCSELVRLLYVGHLIVHAAHINRG